MNFGGHLITGWLISRCLKESSLKERRIITAMAVLPDIDAFSMAYPSLLGDWHRTFGHNVFFFAFAPLIFLPIFKRERIKAIIPILYITLFTHFILDLLVTGWWALYPFWPINKDYTILTSLYIPENIMKIYIQLGLLLVLIIAAVMVYRKSGSSPFEVISTDFDKFMTNFMITPFSKKRCICGARAFYICEGCGLACCGRHVRFKKWFRTICADCISRGQKDA